MRVTSGLPGDKARDIEAFLQVSNNPARPVLPPVTAGPPRESGAELLDRYACHGCHVINGQGGTAGPALDYLFERRDEKWIHDQIQRPRSHNPATVMPDLGLTDAQVNAIIDALRQAP